MCKLLFSTLAAEYLFLFSENSPYDDCGHACSNTRGTSFFPPNCKGLL